ncbi:hypothetical protein AVEN_8918-1 [Araneus ventricosus]|uniref:Uncharacterized protein n=1 Tax=Araneus ventricosus TaxID=182803 RepID=A0A4Y2DFH0_ARAVE|nr:hypothetical protein AVEN_8918-1 [Araneus ventricosus]
MPWMCSLVPEMPENSKVCDSCRKELSKLRNDDKSIATENCISNCKSDLMNCDRLDDDSYIDASSFNESLKSLKDLGESPVDKKRCRYKRYSQEKAHKINSAVERKLLNDEEDSKDEMVNHLINAYQNCKNRTKETMILTL